MSVPKKLGKGGRSLKKQVFLNDTSDVILLYEVFRNSNCKLNMSLVNDYDLMVEYDVAEEVAVLEALTMYSLIALVDEMIYQEFEDIKEDEFIELSAAIVYDEELNKLTNEFLTDYFADNTESKSADVEELRLKLQGFRRFNMNPLIPLINDYIKDFLENEGICEEESLGECRFNDESLREITVVLKETDVFVKMENELVSVEDILLSKQIYMDIETAVDDCEDPILEGNGLYLTALVLVSGTEKINYYQKDEKFILRLVELLAQNGLKVELNEINELE